MDITNPLKLIGTATDAARTILTADTVLEKAELQLKMADVLGALASARVALTEAEAELVARSAEIARLHEARASQGAIAPGRGGFFWKTDAAGTKLGYPCCPACLENDGRQTTLVQNGSARSGRCPRCDKTFAPVSYYRPDGMAQDELEASEQREAFRKLGESLA